MPRGSSAGHFFVRKVKIVANNLLELSVANFGPIVAGRVDLRLLTVFAGPSNTGKSWLAILIYALHRFFSEGIQSSSYISSEDEASRQAIDALSEWAADTLGSQAEPTAVRNGEMLFALPATVTEAIRAHLEKQTNALAREISRSFGADIKSLMRKERNGKETTVTARVRASDSESVRFEHRLSIKPPGFCSDFVDSPSLVTSAKEGPTPDLFRHLARSHQDGTDRSRHRYWYGHTLDLLLEHTLPDIVGSLHRPAWYLPADRTGIMHAHSVVVSALIESAPMAGIHSAKQMPTLSGVLADFLEQLIRLGSRSYRHPLRKTRAGPAEQIESAILQGSVITETGEHTNYPRFTYRPSGWRKSLPLMNVSSMVSELAPVVLFLRHLVARGDLLIIEEPESHLHPAMQVEFIRQIARLVRSGIRVLVTTHSEWVLEELSNIVLASSAPKSVKASSRDNSVALEKSEVGVWAFKPERRPKGTVIEEVALDTSGDLYSAIFDDVSVETYNRWVTLGDMVSSCQCNAPEVEGQVARHPLASRKHGSIKMAIRSNHNSASPTPPRGQPAMTRCTS